MKRIATILLLIFGLVQVAPAFQPLFQQGKGYVFNIDEEKGAEKTAGDKKFSQKDYTDHASAGRALATISLARFERKIVLQPAPCLDKITPPPNC